MKLHVVLALSLLLGFVVHPGPAQASYVVHANGTGEFTTIQDAIDAAPNGSVIELADGTYVGDGNRDLSYFGKAITIRSQGGAANCIIDPWGDGELDQHVGFTFHSGEGPTSVLEGVTIRGANHAIVVFSSPVIRDCILTGNNSGLIHTVGQGAGIACGGGSAYFVGCTISNNYTGGNWFYGEGGGAYIMTSSPTFDHCAFLSNGADPSTPAGGGGGNIFCANDSNPSFLDCTISDGFADKGGGVCCDHSTATFTRCVFADNGGGQMGYRVRVGAGAYCANSHATFSDCIFVNNGAENGGGGMWCVNSSVDLGNCTFYENYAEGPGSSIGLDGASVATIENTIIISINGSYYSDAVTCGGASGATLTCCDLYGNPGGDWVGCIAAQAGVNGNISLDPLFCGAPIRDFHIDASSPCRPFSLPNPQCDLIGALPVLCGIIPTKAMSWGQIKAAYR